MFQTIRLKDMESVKTFIERNSIVDVRLIKLVTDTSPKLTEQNLSDSKRTELVIDTLKRISRNCHDLASKKTIFFNFFKEKEDYALFRQNLMVLTFILHTAFRYEWFENISKNVIDWSNKLNHNEEIWSNLKYKAIRVLSLDLIVELFVLFIQLNNAYFSEMDKDYSKPPPSNYFFYGKFIKLCSLSHEYFQFRLSQIEKIIDTEREYNCLNYTRKVLTINQSRRKSLVSYYNEIYETSFEEEVFLITRELIDWEKVQSTCNLANLTPLANKSELDSKLL